MEDKPLKKYVDCIYRFNNPRFQDITPLFNDSVPFLVSGEMLMLTAVRDENYNDVLGGQTLHFIYICERLLNIFKKNNGTFEIVFFDVWENIFKNSQLLLYRQILKEHFKNNTNIRVHNFVSVYDPRFSILIDNVRPGFFLYNLGAMRYTKFLRKKYAGVRMSDFVAMFCAEFVFCLKSDLPVVDIATIDLDVSVVKSYLLENDIHYKRLPNFERDVLQIVHKKCEKRGNCIFVFKCDEIRELLICNAVYDFLMEYPKRTDDVRLFILYVVVLETFKLRNRGCPIVDVIDEEINNKILIWQKIIFLRLKNVENVANWKNVCDLWQGTLLAVVYSSITIDTYSKDLGELATFYERYIEKINKNQLKTLTPYPIKPYEKTIGIFTMPYCKEDAQVPFEVIDSPIVRRFCGDLVGHITWADYEAVFEEHYYFDEVRHWHSRRTITDDYDHVKQDNFDKQNPTKEDIKRYQRSKDLSARYINIYGTNLVGQGQIYEPIICEKDLKQAKKHKESKTGKAMAIIAQNEKKKEEKNKLEDTEKFAALKTKYKATSDLNGYKKILNEVELLIARIETTEIFLESLILKVQILDQICEKEMKTKRVSENDVENLFLTIREILQIHHSKCGLTEKQQKNIFKVLLKLGFKDIAECNQLIPPKIVDNSEMYNSEDSVRFQLRRLGTKLEREVTGEYDPDLRFTPDPWQTQFIQAIRNNQSALVVAPTSSGKTYASYYCMKRVLRKSKDGVVVYVSPTKALVNQVHATISVKFSNVPSQPGIATVGIFTRDYRTNALNSRILVTVPQCLEILLLSPRRYTWAKKIKYVIFDEIHCLKGNSGDDSGITWERCILLIRCPFLALSATIRNPEGFHQWLSDTERFKQQEDVRNGFERCYSSEVKLVIYSERHSDLVKYTYLKDKGLQHCHPYSVLDHDVLNLYGGVPDGTSLSSFELLQLYDALKTYASQYFTGENEINTFFATHSKNGFITHNHVKEFERVLSKIFYDVFLTDVESYHMILKTLQPTHSTTRDDVGFIYSKENMMDLLTILNKNNMLPAIIFCYNRSYIEAFSSHLVEYFQSHTEDLDRREAKKLEKAEKKKKKELHKLEAKAGESGTSYKKAHSSTDFDILEETESFLKGVGVIDRNDIQFIENRLSRQAGPYRDLLESSMKHGFAFHHAGLNNHYRSAIEMLFRVGVLKMVFATGTLAMGIHMPCKTAVICCDSPFLSSLEYHQMAGRAGRRGFDNVGNVIFMGLNKRKQKTLLSSRLPVIDGNFPLTITFIMRLLLLVTRVTDRDEQTDECRERTLSSVINLLENSLSYRKFPLLRDQMKRFFCFGTKLLCLQKLISPDGIPLQLCNIITHLHYHEPANLALVYLLRKGAIRKMIEDCGQRNDDIIQWNLILVMNFLFARLPLHETQIEKANNNQFDNSCVILEPIPKIINETLRQYNNEVKFVFDEYFASMCSYCNETLGDDNTLPLSGLKIENGVTFANNEEKSILNKIKQHCQTRMICSTFCSLSSHGDDKLYSERNLINNIRNEVCPEVKVVPIIDVDLKINSYAADFYRHGIVAAIRNDNGLNHGEEFNRLKDFYLVLKTVVLALEELEPVEENDVVLYHFQKILYKYQENYNNTFKK